jgi:hypothetical protein
MRTRAKAHTYIQGVPKMLGQTLSVSSSHQSRGRSSYKHMLGNKWFLNLIEGLHEQ